jgi:hypothetical protein
MDVERPYESAERKFLYAVNENMPPLAAKNTSLMRIVSRVTRAWSPSTCAAFTCQEVEVG